MTKGEKFVAHYPLMFKEDKWWWAQELDKHFAEKFKCISCDAEVEQEDMACSEPLGKIERAGVRFLN